MDKFITLAELRERLSYRSRNAILRDVERGDLPRPVRLGGGMGPLYWNEREVSEALHKLAGMQADGGSADDR